MIKEKKTANYKTIHGDKGIKYQFFCDLSEALVYESEPLSGANPEEELMLIWENSGKEHFNRCHKCGKWVIDAMYNPDVLNCVKCTPIEDYPEFCPKCGAKTSDPSYFCHMCGVKLLYGGEKENED